MMTSMVLETPNGGNPPRQTSGIFYACRSPAGPSLHGRGWPEYKTLRGNTSGAPTALFDPRPPEPFRHLARGFQHV